MKLSDKSWLLLTTIFLTIFVCCDAVIHSKGVSKNYNSHFGTNFLVHKVSLTQKGYIQFLRYISDVPVLTEYTFCIWVNSKNLTYNHPLLSYSKHEEERLIRMWISPQGTHLNLEILEIPIFKVPVQMVEDHWYHICQSWSSHQAAWNLYLNGKLRSGGFIPQLKGISIKEGGDIVVGQEYTDFDKGLDDGIEGDIYGFNFVLSSTSASAKQYPSTESTNFLRRKYYLPPPNRYPIPIHPNEHFENYPKEAADVPVVLSYFQMEPNRQPKGLLDVGRNIWNNLFNIFEPETVSPYNSRVVYPNQIREKMPYVANRVLNDLYDFNTKPLGLRLVELSFDCALGKGAPVSGKGVLVSWTKTPVRVFGGAILKNIPPFCT